MYGNALATRGIHTLNPIHWSLFGLNCLISYSESFGDVCRWIWVISKKAALAVFRPSVAVVLGLANRPPVERQIYSSGGIKLLIRLSGNEKQISAFHEKLNYSKGSKQQIMFWSWLFFFLPSFCRRAKGIIRALEADTFVLEGVTRSAPCWAW